MVVAINPYQHVVQGRAPAQRQPQQRRANLQMVPGQYQGQYVQQYGQPQYQQPAPQRYPLPPRPQPQPAIQRQAAAPTWYQQWQQTPQPQQYGYGAPPPPPTQYGYTQEAPALQQARQAGYQQYQPYQPIERFASRAEEQLYDPSGQFNPLAYGGEQFRNGIRQAMPDPQQRMFDRQGQVNAWDKRDALQQATHLLQNSTHYARQAQMQRRASPMVTEERRRILAAAVQDPEGFQILGQELLLPIKDLVDYEGWARKCYRVRPLAQGELFRIAKDVRSTAWIIGQDGQGIEARLYGRYVTPSEFKIGSFPTVDIEQIYQMNYDVLDRAQSTARQEIELEEDKRGRALIDVASQTVNTVTLFGTLGVAAFEDVRYQIERHRLVCEKFLINRRELSDIVKTMSAQVDPVTERELILAGYIGSFLNSVILTSAGTGVQEVVPAGQFYGITGPEYMGEMGIRVELFSESFNMFSQMRFVKGWAYGEIIGFVIANARACAKGTK